MHRSQILLEDWQYEELKAKAERQGTSISEIVRDIVSREMKNSSTSVHKQLSQLRGIGSSNISAREAKKILYRPELYRP